MKHRTLGHIMIFIGIISSIIILIIGSGVIFEIYKFITSILFQITWFIIGFYLLEKNK